jgi:hypothetical protein
MEAIRTPLEEHGFEEICARVEDFEPLPTVTVGPKEDDERSEDEQREPIDGLILAGLVSP